MRTYIEPHKLNQKRGMATLLCILIAVAPTVLILLTYLFHSFAIWEWTTLDFSTWSKGSRVIYGVVSITSTLIAGGVFVEDIKKLNKKYTTEKGT